MQTKTKQKTAALISGRSVRMLGLSLAFIFFMGFCKEASCWTFGEITRLKGGYLFCASEDSLNQARKIVADNDSSAFNKFSSTAICGFTKEGAEVYVVRQHPFHGSFEIRLKGETHVFWVDQEAIPDSFTIDSNTEVKTQQAQASTKNFKNVCKLEGVLEEKGRPVIFVSQQGKVSSIKVGDHICGGEIVQTYSPGEPDGITPEQSLDKYQYRIKVKIGKEEIIFKNGDVICGDANNLSPPTSDSVNVPLLKESGAEPTSKPSLPVPLGMNHVTDAEENFKKAQEAERQGLHRRASYFYERAVQAAQSALAFIIKDKRDAMRTIIKEGEQKHRDLLGKEDVDLTTAESINWPKLKNANEIAAWLKANITYNSDEKLHGERDYWQTPEETLILRSGDCEDFAFLSQALLKRINIESTVLCVYVKHFAEEFSHAICVFPKDAPTNYFSNRNVRTSNTHVLYSIKSEYPNCQRVSILEFADRKSRAILETKWPFVYKVKSSENAEFFKTFFGKEDGQGTLFF